MIDALLREFEIGVGGYRDTIFMHPRYMREIGDGRQDEG